MKYLIYTSVIILTMILSSHEANGQRPDTVSSRKLGEVVVKGDRRFDRGDTINVIPNANQRKFSFSGYELIRSSQLPGLKVDPLNGTISLFSGESVMVQIDGRPVERRDIQALRPNEVARIEYVQNPGSEYGFDSNVGALIDIIRKVRTDGYAASVMANNAVTTGTGENFIFGKYTKGNSELSLSLSSTYASLSRRRIDDDNTYIIDGRLHSVMFKGMNTYLQYSSNEIELEFNNYKPNKHIFDASLRGVFYYSPDRAHKQYVTESGVLPYYQLTKPYEKYLAPRLSLYYKKFIDKKSNISANFVANYRYTDYHQNILESSSEDMSNSSWRVGVAGQYLLYKDGATQGGLS